MKKVLYIIDALAHGGGERYVFELIRCLGNDNINCHLCNIGRDMSVAHWFTRLGIEPIHIPTRGKIDPFLPIYLARLIKKLRVDIVHCVGNRANFYGTVAGRFSGNIIMVASEHNPFSNLATRFRAMLAGRLAHGYIAVSKACKDALVKQAYVPENKVKIIYHGIDMERFPKMGQVKTLRYCLGLKDQTIIIGTVGRLKPQKNYPRFLRVARRIKSILPDITFVIVGEGPLENSIKEMAESLGLKDCIHFLGARDDVPQLMQEFDIFLLASDREGFGIVLLEAQYCGIPIVVTNSGGSVEAVEDGKTAFVIAPEDEDGLADACVKLATSSILRRNLGEAGRRRVQELFSLQRMIDETKEFYNHLCGNHSREESNVSN